MRPLIFSLLLSAIALAAAPIPRAPDVGKVIDALGSDDSDARKAAEKKLIDLGETILPALQQASKKHPDVDVRLRLLIVLRAIHARSWGLIKALGPGAALKVRPSGDGYWLNRVRFSRDGKYAVAGGGALILYDIETGKEKGRVLEVGGARPGLAISADGKHALTGHARSPEFHLVELPSLKTVQTFKGIPGGGVYAVAFSPDGKTVACSHVANSTVHLWDIKTGKDLGYLSGLDNASPGFAFMPDGKRMVLAQYPNGKGDVVWLYDIKTNKKLRGYAGLDGSIICLALSPDAKTVLAGDSKGRLVVWDVASGKALHTMEHGSYVNDVAISPDGKRAVSGGYQDNKVCVWDLRTGKRLETFVGHLGRVLGVSFSRDGKRAISCDSVCCVRVWRLGK